jgi:hypothetical protein
VSLLLLPRLLPPRSFRYMPSNENPAICGVFFGADARIRTADPFITSEVLYQLSYVGAPSL